MKKTLVGLMLLLLFAPGLARAQQDIPVSAAVVPFESFTGDQKTALGRDVAVKLLQQLAGNPLIITPDVQSMKEVFTRDDAGTPSEERLREVAKHLNVNFLIYGSVTQVKEAISIDAQVYYNFPGDHYYKTFAEGPELDKAVEALAGKLEQELVDKAASIPGQLRPKARPRRQVQAAVPEAMDYEKTVNRELAAEQDAGEDELRHIKGAQSSELEDLEEEEAPKAMAAKPHKKHAEAGEGREKGERGEAAKSFKLEQPVNISADTMEYSNKENTAIFKGNVVARQGDLSLFANQVEATYAGKLGDKSEKGGIKELVATGNVKIIQGERIATGQKIVFYGEEQKIVATGEPRVWQGNNVIVGKKITVYLKQDRSVVEGSTQDRVSATIYPKEKKSKNQ